MFAGIVLLTMMSAISGLAWNLQRARHDFQAWLDHAPAFQSYFTNAELMPAPTLYENRKRPFDRIDILYYRHNPRTSLFSRHDALARRTSDGWDVTVEK